MKKDKENEETNLGYKRMMKTLIKNLVKLVYGVDGGNEKWEHRLKRGKDEEKCPQNSLENSGNKKNEWDILTFGKIYK